MRRREFITLAGGAAAWPVVGRAQAAMPLIGFLNGGPGDGSSGSRLGMLQGLKDAGYIEGQNVAVEYRWADGQYDRLPALAADLVHHQVKVIATSGSANSALAAKAATSIIPIVFASGGDPIQLGLVTSLSRPDGNMTGVTFLVNRLGAKRLELVRELLPAAASIGILENPANASSQSEADDTQDAARTLGVQVQALKAGNEQELDAAFALAAQQKLSAIVVAADTFLFNDRDLVVALAMKNQMPAIYPRSEFIEAGGLMSYATNVADMYVQQGRYVGRILKGEKPADLPVQQSTKVELVINLKVAKALGLDVPTALLVRADEVIE